MKISRAQKRLIKKIQAMDHATQVKTIQAMKIEGLDYNMTMDNLLTGEPIGGVDGTVNLYRSYSAQVTATYKKYAGEDEFGNDQARTVIDSRTAFIAGEGLSVALGDKVNGEEQGYSELFKEFLEKNKLDSIRLFDITRATEMCGYAIVSVLPTDEKFEYIPILGLLNTNRGKAFYQPILRNPMNPYSIKGFHKVVDKDKVKINITNAIYIRTGGYGYIEDYPTTKVGIILTECDNYDRALKDMRELNYRMARITPDFQTKSSAETKTVSEALKAKKWKIGQARVGTAVFSYKAPTTGAHDNLKTEMTSNLKTISGNSSVPVHWFGWVDQMSNRATAQELYAMVNNGTIMEREAIESAMREAIILMQETYIDSGGTLITEVTKDFEVRLPLIDFGRFESTVKAYSMLHADEIISTQTYRNIVPGIDPILEQRLIDQEREKEMIRQSEFDDEDEEDDDDEKDPEEDKNE